MKFFLIMMMLLPLVTMATTEEESPKIVKTCYTASVELKGQLTIGDEWRGGVERTKFCNTVVFDRYDYCTQENKAGVLKINCKIFEMVAASRPQNVL